MPSNQFPSSNGGDSGNSGWFLFDPSKGAGNQAKKQPSAPVYDAPQVDKLDSNEAYDQALKYQAAAGRNALSQQTSGMAEAGRQSLENYQAKSAIDSRQKLIDAQNANATQNQAGRGFAGGGASITGAGAFVNPRAMADPYGMSGMRADFGALQDFRDRQNMALESTRAFGKANADTDIYRQTGLNRANQNAAFQQQQRDIDMMNRQSSLDAQGKANDFYRNRELAGLEAGSRERIAGMQAQAGILGSLFSSVGSGNPNYRYWG